MPNLNKIRGRGGGGGGVGGGPANGGRGGRGVGASSGPANNSGLQRPSNLGASTRHHSSDPRLQQQPQPGQQQSRIGSGGVRGVYGGRPSYAGPPTSHTNEVRRNKKFFSHQLFSKKKLTAAVAMELQGDDEKRPRKPLLRKGTFAVRTKRPPEPLTLDEAAADLETLRQNGDELNAIGVSSGPPDICEEQNEKDQGDMDGVHMS